MITLCLGPAVAMSDAADWTTARKIIAVLWIAMVDVCIVALCCW